MLSVAVIDYGGSNLRSVSKALETVAGKRARVVVTDDVKRIAAADRVVFPGQGAIGNCMTRLHETGLVDAIRESVKTHPFLGICLGLQSLMDRSDEDGGTPCLGLYPGGVRHFTRNPPPGADGTPQKIPHMGWNQVRWTRRDGLSSLRQQPSHVELQLLRLLRPSSAGLSSHHRAVGQSCSCSAAYFAVQMGSCLAYCIAGRASQRIRQSTGGTRRTSLRRTRNALLRCPS